MTTAYMLMTFSSSFMVLEELNNERIAEKIRQIAKGNQIDLGEIELLYEPGMPEEIQGMTLGTQGIVLGPAALRSLPTLITVLKHELQHIQDRKALGDSEAHGTELEQRARLAEEKE